ncbi:MAG TPA: gluconate 2-dehydrogenase subunit 3 family protein [Terriglobia bacterium]|jgi:gluconate 2-dehydrogenase gamma chain|nr:gluconate 2-dehydrogenase subunit 3 family protein [Terriglobia bacterium]
MEDSKVDSRRRSVLKTIGLGAGAMTALPVIGSGSVRPEAARQAAPAAAVQAPGAEAEWKPLFFDEHQNQTVVVLTELIMPATETPGAKEAQVNRLIDLTLNESEKDVTSGFIEGLAWLDGRSLSRHGKPFVDLSPEQQTAMLDPLADPANHNPEDQPGVRFFERIKNYTIFGYYTSRIGLDQELQYGGDDYHTEFPGACTHPEHLQS